MATGNIIINVSAPGSGSTEASLKSVQRSADDLRKSIGRGFTSAGKTLTAGLTLPILALGGVIANLAIDAAETESRIGATFEGMEDSLAEWSENSSANITATTNDIEGAAATFFVMATGMGVAEDAAFDMATGFVDLGGDLASFHNLSNAEAFDKISQAMAGSSEGLGALGIDVRQAALETFGLENGMLAAGEEMDGAKRQAILFAKVMQDMGPALGDVESTQDSAANAIKTLMADLTEAGEELGAILIPIIIEIVDTVSGWISSFQELDGPQKEMIVTVLAIAAAVGPMLLIIGQIITIAPLIATAVTIMFGPWGLVIAAVIAGVALVIANWDEIKAAAIVLGEAVLEAIQPIIDWFLTNLPLMQETWQTILDNIKAFWDRWGGLITAAWNFIWDGIKAAVELIWNGIKLGFEVFFEFMGGFLTAGMQIINGDWDEAWETIKKTGQAIWDSISDAWDTMLDNIMSALTGWIDNIKEMWEGLGDALVFGSIIPDITKAIEEDWEEMFVAMIVDTQTGLGRIKQEFSQFAPDISDIISDGIIGPLSGGTDPAGGEDETTFFTRESQERDIALMAAKGLLQGGERGASSAIGGISSLLLAPALGPFAGLAGGLLGDVFGGLFGGRRPDPVMEAVPVTVVNFEDMGTALLNVIKGQLTGIASQGIDSLNAQVRLRERMIAIN